MPSSDDPRLEETLAGRSSSPHVDPSESDDETVAPAEVVPATPTDQSDSQDTVAAETLVLSYADTAASAGQPAAPQATGLRRFGDYELIGELARGGMGVVYRARQVSLNRTVALKMILAGQLADDAAVQRFHTEAEAAAKLDHPGIVPIHEVGQHEGQHYFSMGFVEGQSLANKLADGPLPPEEAVELVKKLAEAMAYAHEHGVIHRDLKPANVLLDQQGQPRIADFGLAKELEADSNLTGTGQILGTPSYMPPEQAAGKTDQIGPAADVYALGAVLYALLTGRPPFQAANTMDTLLQVLDKEPVSPRQLDPKVPPDLETICLKCLEKDRQRRYAAAQDLADELQRFLNGEPIVARPIGRTARAWRWCKRKPVVAGLAAAVALSLVVGTCVSTMLAVNAARETAEARRQREEARRQRETAETQLLRSEGLLYASQIAASQREWDTGNQALAWEYLDRCRWDFRGWEHDWLYTRFTKTMDLRETRYGGGDRVDSVAFSPDGRLIASGHQGAREDEPAIKVWDAATGQELFRLEGDASGITSLAFSPDGKRIVSRSTDKTLKLWDIESRRELLTVEGCVAFSPDGRRIVSRCRGARGFESGIKVWDAATDQEMSSLWGHADDVTSLAFSPDGKRIASGSKDNTLKVWDTESRRELLTLKGHTGDVSGVAFSPDGRRIASGSSDKTLRVWDAESGRQVLSLETGRDRGVTGVAFSPDGRRIVTDHEVWLKFWDAESGQEVLKLGTDRSGFGHAASVDFSPDGKWIVTGGRFGNLTVWNAASGEEARTLESREVVRVAFSPDGRRIAGIGQGSLRTWDAESGQELLRHSISFERNWEAVAFSPDGRRIFSGGFNTLRVWDAISGDDALTFKGYTDPITSVAFSPDGQRIVSGSRDKKLKVWDANSGQLLLMLEGHSDEVLSVAFSPDGGWIASGSKDKTARVWDAASGQEVLKLDASTSYEGVTTVAFSPDGQQIASADGSNTAKVWDAAGGQEVLSLQTSSMSEGGIRTMTFTADGKRIVGGDRFLRVWDAENGEEVVTLKRGSSGGFAGPDTVAVSADGRRIVYCGDRNKFEVWDAGNGQQMLSVEAVGAQRGLSLAISPDGRRIFGGIRHRPGVHNPDQTLKVWDAESGQELFDLQGHTLSVNSVAVSPDGDRLVSGGDDGMLRVWDTSSGQLINSFKVRGHTGHVRGVGFSPDGRQVVSASHDGTLIVWDSATARPLRTLKGHTSWVSCVAFSPDGRRIVSGSFDRTLKVWDPATGQQTLTFTGHTGAIRSVGFSPDGLRIVSGGDGRAANVYAEAKVKIWNAEGGQELLTIDHKQASSVSFSPDGRRLLIQSEIYDAETGEQLLKLEDAGPLTAFSPDGQRIVSGSPYGIVFSPDSDSERLFVGNTNTLLGVWDAQSGEQLLNLKGHTEAVQAVAFSPDGRRIVSGSDDRTLKVWDADNGIELLTIKGHARSVGALAFSPDGRRIASGSDDNTLKIWEAGSRQWTSTLEGHTAMDATASLVFSPEGQRIFYCGGRPSRLEVWDAASGRPILRLEGTPTVHHLNAQDLAISPDGQLLVVGGRVQHHQEVATDEGANLQVWDSKSGKELAVFKGHTGEVFAVAFSPDGRRIVSGGSDRTLRLWDAGSGRERRTLQGHAQPVTSVAFTPDGRRVVSGSQDNTAKIWDAGRGKVVHTLVGHTAAITSVTVSPDGRRVVSGSHDGTLKVWDADSGKIVLSQQATEGLRGEAVTRVAFSPDGRWFVSGSGTFLKLWDAADGQQIVLLRDRDFQQVNAGADPFAIAALAVSPDGKRIASARRDGAVKVRDVTRFTTEP